MKKRIARRLMSMLLTLTMVVSLFAGIPQTAMAEDVPGGEPDLGFGLETGQVFEGYSVSGIVPNNSQIQLEVGETSKYEPEVVLEQSLMAVNASPEEDFEFDEATGTIFGYVGEGGAVVIPETIGGVAVTKIYDSIFWGYLNLTSIIIPGSVTSMGDNPFYGCESLQEINVDEDNNNYSSLDGVLFNKTKTELMKYPEGKVQTAYVIPDSVTSIGDWAFYDCDSLTSISIPSSVNGIGECAFHYCSNLASINIPGSVTSISDYAFYYCSSLISINIPSSVTSIGDYAFWGCDSLTNIDIPNGVTSIGFETFAGCSNLTSIAIPSSVASIGNHAFLNCESLQEINVDEANNNYSSVDGVLFDETKTEFMKYPEGKFQTEYAIPSSVTSIYYSAFANCGSLTSIAIPNSVTDILGAAFENCSSLTSINIPNSVTRISAGTFRGCSSLTSIVIPSGVTSIGMRAFQYCSSLISITIPSSVTSIIGDEVFSECNNLTIYGEDNSYAKTYAEVNNIPFSIIPGGIPASAFPAIIKQPESKAVLEGSSITLTVEAESTDGGTLTYQWQKDGIDTPGAAGTSYTINSAASTDEGSYRVIVTNTMSASTPATIASNVAVLTVVVVSPDEDFGFDESTGTITGYRGSGGAVVIPETIGGVAVTKIGDYAFEECSSLISIDIPGSVTSIGRYAFYNCDSLTSINIPNGVTSISSSAFYNCSSLISINMPNGVTSISDWAFYNCMSLTNITIPNGVTKIGKDAFFNCKNLTSINIPSSVTYVDINPFRNCESLQEINVDAGNIYYFSLEGVLFCEYDRGTSLEIYPGGKIQTEYVIPSTVKGISCYAFFNCENLNSINIPDGLTYISTYAFQGCSSLTSINIPNNLKYINEAVFLGCSSLKSIYIPNSVTSIGRYAFKDCSGLTNINIPSSVTDIDDYAFRYCSNLAWAKFEGNAPNNFGDYVFAGCAPDFIIYYYKGATGFTNPWHGYPTEAVGGGSTGSGMSGITSPTSPIYSTDEQQILDSLKIDTQELIDNISLGNHPIKGPSVTFFGQTFYLFEFEGKLEFKYKNMNVQAKVDTDKKTVQFLIGYKIFSEEADLSNEYNNSAYWSQSYQQVKSLYQGVTGNKVDTPGLWNQFSSLRGQLKEFDSDLLVDAKCKVAGFMELSYETGTAQFSEGGFLMEASIGGEFVGRIPAFPAAYAVLGLKASTEGKIFIAYETNISINSELNAKIAANVGVGLGFKKAKTYIEGGLKGTLGAKMFAVSGSFRDYTSELEPLVVTIEGNIYLKASLAGFNVDEGEWPIGSPVQLYPRNNTALKSMQLFANEDINTVIKNAVPIERDYLNKTYSLRGVELFALGADDKLYSDTSVYDYNAPVLTVLADGSLLLIWVDDLGNKNDVNKTSLMYSVYDGLGWSAPIEIFETGKYNGAPVICNNGETVDVIWSKAKTIFPDNAQLADLITDTELYYTSYENGIFSEPIQITDNSLMETNYDVVRENNNVAIIWTENSANNPYMTSGTNTLYIKELQNNVWQAKRQVAEKTQAVSDITAYYHDGTVNCAYAVTASDNSSLVYNNESLISAGSYINYENGMIFYLNNDSIMKYDVATDTTEETGLSGVNNFSIHNNNIYTLISTGFKCELYESLGTGNVWGDFKQVTEYDRYIRDYYVTSDETGEPVYALNLVDVNDSGSIYGNSELAVCGASEVNDLGLSAVYYDHEYIAPNTVLPIGLDIINNGTSDVSFVNVQYSDESGTVLASERIDAIIPWGETVSVESSFSLPESIALSNITVAISGEAEERNTENNSSSFTYGYADALMSDLTIARTPTGAVVTGTVENIGFSPLQNVTVIMTDSGSMDILLNSVDCGAIDVGSEYDFSFQVPAQYLTLDDKLTMHGLYFYAETETEEADYANNKDKIVFGELTDYTIAMVDGNTLLDIISVGDFESYVYEKDGYLLEGWYTDSNFAEWTKLTVIPEYISEDLIAYAKLVPTTTLLYGDVNGDGSINSSDHQRLFEHLNGTNLLTGDALTAGDVNKDGNINSSDHQRLFEHLNGTNPLS